MSQLATALWAEVAKTRRTNVPWLTALGFALAPLMGGLFMFILKNPAAAQSMGLISAKAQLRAGVADWPTYLNVLAQATAVGGALLFALVTAWVFGREFADHAAKNLLAMPTPRAATVGAKFVLVVVWTSALTLMIFLIGLVVGQIVILPGWSPAVLAQAVRDLVGTAVLTMALMPLVAFVASAARSYFAALGWAILTLFLAQVVAATGWGQWFPWTVPALYSGMAGPAAAQLDFVSYILVAAACVLGLAATFLWWEYADQTR